MPEIHIAILSCHIRLKNGQTVATLRTTQGKQGQPDFLVIGEAVTAAMNEYRNLPDNNIDGFSIAEIRMETVEIAEQVTLCNGEAESEREIAAVTKSTKRVRPMPEAGL